MSTRIPREDNFTNTPEQAAAYERDRAADMWDDNRPTKAELDREEAERGRERYEEWWR